MIKTNNEWNGKEWMELFRHYDKDITENEVDYFLWNETCFPFDEETAMKQIIEYYTQPTDKPIIG